VIGAELCPTESDTLAFGLAMDASLLERVTGAARSAGASSVIAGVKPPGTAASCPAPTSVVEKEKRSAG